jgi:hypothetical protein
MTALPDPVALIWRDLDEWPAARRGRSAKRVYSLASSARCAHARDPEAPAWAPDAYPFLLGTEGEAPSADASG